MTFFVKSCVDFRYEKSLNLEVQEWLSLLHKTQNKLHRFDFFFFHKNFFNFSILLSSKEQLTTVDISTLPKDKRQYLNNAPDLQKFIKDSVEFQREADIYINKDYAQLVKMREDLNAVFNYRLTAAKAAILKKHSE